MCSFVLEELDMARGRGSVKRTALMHCFCHNNEAVAWKFSFILFALSNYCCLHLCFFWSSHTWGLHSISDKSFSWQGFHVEYLFPESSWGWINNLRKGNEGLWKASTEKHGSEQLTHVRIRKHGFYIYLIHSVTALAFVIVVVSVVPDANVLHLPPHWSWQRGPYADQPSCLFSKTQRQDTEANSQGVVLKNIVAVWVCFICPLSIPFFLKAKLYTNADPG